MNFYNESQKEREFATIELFDSQISGNFSKSLKHLSIWLINSLSLLLINIGTAYVQRTPFLSRSKLNQSEIFVAEIFRKFKQTRHFGVLLNLKLTNIKI